MNDLLNCGLGLVIIWVFFLLGMFIWNNPFKAAKGQSGDVRRANRGDQRRT